MIGKAARINSPTVASSLAFNDDFRQQLASTARLNNAKSKDTSLKRIWHAWHRPNQWQSIWRVGNGAIDHARDSGRAKKRHAGASIFNIPFQPFQIVII